jgi:hypothetical protein
VSRSGYSDDGNDDWRYVMWRGAVASSIRGKRGQAFLREMRDALDTMPEKRLAPDALVQGGEVCAIGCVGLRRGVNMETLDADDADQVGIAFGIAAALVREIVFMNDEGSCQIGQETPEQRWHRMRGWVEAQLRKAPEGAAAG